MDRTYVPWHLVDLSRAIRGSNASLWTLDERGHQWAMDSGFWCGPLHAPQASAHASVSLWRPPPDVLARAIANPSMDWRFSRIAAACAWADIHVQQAWLLRDMSAPGLAIIGEHVEVIVKQHRVRIVRQLDDAVRLALLILSTFPAERVLVPQLLESASLRGNAMRAQLYSIAVNPIHA